MKPNLPTQLFRALLTSCAAALIATSPAFADVPSGYTEVNITSASQLKAYQTSDNCAFVIGSDITDSEYRMSGANQYWSDNANRIHSLTFTGLETTAGGGAIRADQRLYAGNFLTLNFSGNKAPGGAIWSGGSTALENNDNLIFDGNSTQWGYGGGAIHNVIGTTTISGNDNVSFLGNSAMRAGAIYIESGTVSLKDNKTVVFNGNKSSYEGGAISAEKYASVNITNNEHIEFVENVAKITGVYVGGGAINSSNDVNISSNDYILFSKNSSETYGGAINAYSLGLRYNGTVVFEYNYAPGGAVYSKGAVNIIGNEHVVFEKNSGGTKGRGLYLVGQTLNLAAGEGQDIIFYDTLYAKADSGSLSVSFNKDFRDENNVLQKATGDIIFSGSSAWASEVYATTYLYGGQMRFENYAKFIGNGINVVANSNATLRLNKGSLDLTGYSVLLNNTTTLELLGTNSITADLLEMKDGSTLSFNTDAAPGALLNLDAALMTGDFNVSVSGDMTQEHALLKLADVSQYDLTQWNSGQVNVAGTDFEHLFWKDGVLSYKPWESTHTDIEKDTEVDDFGGDEGVDIEGNGHKLTVKHPVDLVHLAMNDGIVRLEGENNNVVRITLTEDGTLELAAGAGLKVGNIVSMVANGSADLVISGNVEITDIKAYGKPGNKGTLSYVNMTTAADYTIENMSISGSVIDIGKGTTMYMVNVDIHADSRITDDAAWLDMVNTKAWLNTENTQVGKPSSTDQNMTLYLCGDTQHAITLAADSELVELTSEMFDTVTLTGTDLWLDMTALAEGLRGADAFSLVFTNGTKAKFDVENLTVHAILDEETFLQAYSLQSSGTADKLFFTLTTPAPVPEPATGSLSLLALAALVSRRRRK